MNDLTSVLIDKNSQYDIEEYTKQGQAVTFDSGKEQIAIGGFIPSLEIKVTYRNIPIEKYELLRTAYEDNFANTFKCLFDNNIDKRSQLMTNNAEVYAFKDFQFTVNASALNRMNGSITLVSSVFFNFSQYQDLFSQSSSYTHKSTTNQDFNNILDYAQPYNIVYKYANQSLLSNIGNSVRHAKDKGIRRQWTLQWVLQETDFLKLLLFYRKKSGIMGEFGIPEYGTNAGFDPAPYVEDGYVESGYVSYDPEVDGMTKARFLNDSFQYVKRLDGLYNCQADFIEVKQ